MELKPVLTTVIAGSQYLIHPQVLGTIQETINPDAILPVTVLGSDQLYHDLEGTLKLYDYYDDVFVPEFGFVLVEKSGGDTGISSVPKPINPSRPVMHLRENSQVNKRGIDDLVPGPYILHGPEIHQAWKIYNDTLDAFAFGIFPSTVNGVTEYQVLPRVQNETDFKPIPVPSRLYSSLPPEDAPLKGYRFTIPDAVSLKGIPTSLSSEAWAQLHNASATSTAALAKTLVGMGAVIVGKTKFSQFGSGREWQDVKKPTNPREDQHQDPAGGSTGAATALAGYEWLEAATGLDAIGQSLEPAASQSLFALRTTAGSLSLEGTHISSTSYDTVALLGRDISDLFHNAVGIIHKSLSSPPITFPKRVLYPADLFVTEDKDHASHREFLTAVEAFLGIKAENVSLASKWAANPPIKADGKSLFEFMKDGPFLMFCDDFYQQYDQFRNDYHSKFGKEPDTEPTVQYRWNLGKQVSPRQRGEYHDRLDVFREWFNDNIMSTAHDSDVVMVLPFYNPAPQYNAPKPNKVNGVTSRLLASVLQTPEMIVPFAQFTYQSKYGGTEYHPIYNTIMGPKGSDTMLVKLVEATFQQAQWRTSVDTGRTALPVAPNARMVNDRSSSKAPSSLGDAQVQLEEL